MRHTVLIADDHPVFRQGLRNLLERSFDVVAEAQEGGEAVDKAASTKPNVVVMDISMPGMDGLEAAHKIKEQSPETGVVVISASDHDEEIFRAIKAGVSGYVLKGDEPSSMVQAVQFAAEGKAYLPPFIAKRVIAGMAESLSDNAQSKRKDIAPLSQRELEVLRLMGQGLRNKEIADTLCVSERTVSNHVTSIYNKLGMFDRAQAIIYAIKKGIVRI